MFEEPPVGPQAVPSQWAPDPFERHEYRYFDGRAWTNAVSDAGQIGTDEPIVQLAPPAPMQPALAKGAGASPLLIVGAVAMIIGPFMSWAKLEPLVSIGSTTIRGVQSDQRIWILGTVADGWIVMFLGALLIVLLGKGGFRQRLSAGLQLAVGAAAIAWCAASWYSINRAVDEVFADDDPLFENVSGLMELSPSIGFWCALGGGVVVVVSGLVTWRANSKARSGFDAARLPGTIEPGSAS